MKVHIVMRRKPKATRIAVLFARWILLLVGVVCLGWYGYVGLIRTLYQRSDSLIFDTETSELPGGSGEVKEPAKPWIAPRPQESVKAVARLSLPRLHESAMVREGVDDATLEKAVGHMPSSPLPGRDGNIVLAAHRDTFFRSLREMKTGDEIDLESPAGRFHYRVESMTIVQPDDVTVLRSTTQNVLTLITCYPFTYIGNAPKRFILRAVETGRTHGDENALLTSAAGPGR